MTKISPRLLAIVESLELQSGLRVLEVGCGPGVAAREVASRIGEGHILAIDRSEKSIALARKICRTEISSGRLSLRRVGGSSSTGLRFPLTLPS